MSDSSDKRKKASIAAVFWIILALILLIVFLVNQDTIVRVLKDTDFFVHVFGEQPAFIESYDLPEEDISSSNDVTLSDTKSITQHNDVETIQLTQVSPAPSSLPLEKEDRTEDISDMDAETEQIETVQPVKESTPQTATAQVVTSKQLLYFVFVNGDGTVERKEVVRSVPKSTTPLTASLESLLKGPNAEDKNKGYVSFIPSGTKLLSVSIKDGTALINVSEEFSFNQYGVDGYLAQLMQVVYTATAFNTIKNVRFFIEGEQSSYLGNDGVWIGSPLARTDFK